MRNMFLAAATVVALAASGSAFAQSQQGGYLGQNPGAHQTASAASAADLGSRQGGYLGKNAGGNLAPARAAEANMAGSPMAWCNAASLEPGRCRSRAVYDHAYCMQQDASHYASCRQVMDYIGWHN